MARPAIPRRRKSPAAAAANPARGEHTLQLGAKSYILRPTYQAGAAIEAETGLSLIELFRGANTCSLSLPDLGIVCAAYIRAGASDEMTKRISAERIAELIYEEGLGPVFARVTLVLADAISGGRTTSGEAKAVTEQTV